MANKVVIGILVLLVIITGGIGYYSYTLNVQVDSLSERLATFEAGQTARITDISNELTDLETTTQSSIGSLKGQVEGAVNKIGSLETGLGKAESRIARVAEGVDNISSQVGSLDERISAAEGRISGAVLDANKVYEKVSRATVRVTNGTNTIGSGFIMDADGHVITAYHVINGLSQIFVIMDDGRVSRASVTGFSQFSDVAVLKLEENPSIEPPALADSSKIRIGEPVIAIGSPLNLRDTLTAGVISQVNRFTSYGTDSLSVANLLQFDAPVNPGNSGGPLANARGEILGIVVARITVGDGIYYAVASNKVKRVAAAIIANGTFPYPWIGVSVSDLTPQLVQERSLETANGVLVAGVSASSPAQAAGIRNDDIIVAIDGVSVRDSADLTSYLGEYKSPGDASVIRVIRGSASLDLSIYIGTRQ
jgi:S1-C subfamily serine protease